MKPFVTAVLVAAGDDARLAEALAGLRAQTRPPDRVLLIETAAAGEARQGVELAGLERVADGSSRSLGQALNLALNHTAAANADAVPGAGASHWIWILPEKAVPEANALAEMLRVVEVSPSAGLIGPKLLERGSPRTLVQFGLSLSRNWRLTSPASGQFDQSQFDDADDVLAVGTSGMLARVQMLQQLGGLDRRAPELAADVDLSIRARLAGFRVLLAPGARLHTLRARKSGAALRRAELHLRFVYSVWPVAVVLPLLAVPLAVWRTVLCLLAKRPQLMWAELSSGFWLLATVVARWRARARRAVAVQAGLRSLDGLRPTRRELRRAERDRVEESRAIAGATAGEVARPLMIDGAVDSAAERGEPLRFFGSGASWLALLLIAFGLRNWPSGTAIGGGLLPLSSDWLTLFANAGASYQNLGLGLVAPSDPFNWVLLVVGSLTPWQPNIALSALLVVSNALAFAGAWLLLGLVTNRRWVRHLLALGYALLPPIVGAGLEGRLPALVFCITLPWFALAYARVAGLGGAGLAGAGAGAGGPGLSPERSWSWLGLAGLLFAILGVSAPAALPLLLLAMLAIGGQRPRRLIYLVWTPLPLAALFAPWVWHAVGRLGQPLALLADPGLAQASGQLTPEQLLLGGGASLDSGGILPLLSPYAAAGWLLVAAWGLLVARVALGLQLGLLAVLALAGAWLVQNIAFVAEPDYVAGNPVALQQLAGLALLLLGAAGLNKLASRPLRALAAGAVVLLALLPSAALAVTSTSQVSYGTGNLLPTLVIASAKANPHLRTLVLTTEQATAEQATAEQATAGQAPDEQAPEAGSEAQRLVTGQLVWGAGVTLDDQNLAYRFAMADHSAAAAGYAAVEQLVADLAAGNGVDQSATFGQLGVEFILLKPGERVASAALTVALDSNPQLETVGLTDFGRVWHVRGAASANSGTGPLADDYWSLTKAVQLGVLLAFGLLAWPARGARRRRTPQGSAGNRTDSLPNAAALDGGDESD